MCERLFESSQNFVNQLLNLETVIKKTNEAEETKAPGDCCNTANFFVFTRVLQSSTPHRGRLCVLRKHVRHKSVLLMRLSD